MQTRVLTCCFPLNPVFSRQKKKEQQFCKVLQFPSPPVLRDFCTYLNENCKPRIGLFKHAPPAPPSPLFPLFLWNVDCLKSVQTSYQAFHAINQMDLTFSVGACPASGDALTHPNKHSD